MKAAPFPEQNLVMGADQPEYNPLPAHRSNTPGSVVTSFWQFTTDELLDLLSKAQADGKAGVYVSQCTFGGPLQPLTVQTVFNPPQI